MVSSMAATSSPTSLQLRLAMNCYNRRVSPPTRTRPWMRNMEVGSGSLFLPQNERRFNGDSWIVSSSAADNFAGWSDSDHDSDLPIENQRKKWLGALSSGLKPADLEKKCVSEISLSAGIPAPSAVSAALQVLAGTVLVPVVVDQLQGQTFAALQVLKVIEADDHPSDLCTRREYARWLVAASSALSSPLSRQDLVSWKMALDKRQLPEADKKGVLVQRPSFR